MSEQSTNTFIQKLNYKDILIIFGIWYFIATFNFLMGKIVFKYTPQLTGLIHFSFVFCGRFLYLALILFYLISFHSVSFTELGLSFSNIKQQLFPGFYLITFFGAVALILINLPLSFQTLSSKFDPLYQITNPGHFINSLLPLILIFIPSLIIALSEQLILDNIIYEMFNLKINSTIAAILASLFYSFFLLTFDPGQILINCFIAAISIYLYIRVNGSLYLPTFFMASYYTIYICYIYGWDFIKF